VTAVFLIARIREGLYFQCTGALVTVQTNDLDNWLSTKCISRLLFPFSGGLSSIICLLSSYINIHHFHQQLELLFYSSDDEDDTCMVHEDPGEDDYPSTNSDDDHDGNDLLLLAGNPEKSAKVRIDEVLWYLSSVCHDL